MKIYLAGPLFSAAEQEFNLKLCGKLENLGREVFLPQRYVAENVDFEKENWQEDVFNVNCQEINKSDLVIAILDGAIVDDGTAWEIGHAFSLSKEIYGLRTDFRIVGLEGQVNLMIGQSVEKIFSSVEGLIEFLVENKSV
jgi:nucleoside 2-deoxyribosyltransferase